MNTKIIPYFTRDLVLSMPDHLFIFGENKKDCKSNHPGGGQAIIRGLPNTFGLITKKSVGEYLSDSEYFKNKRMIREQVLLIKYIMSGAESVNRIPKYTTIAFPLQGIGTGRSSMQTECPRTFLFLCESLLLEFKFNNLQSLKNDYI